MWVARDQAGDLYLYHVCPERKENYWWTSQVCLRLDDNLFPNLKWTDEPIEVELIKKEPNYICPDFDLENCEDNCEHKVPHKHMGMCDNDCCSVCVIIKED